MAMLAGLQGVRSAVCSQIATHMIVPTMTSIKTGLHLPSFLDELGIESLDAYVDSNADWLNQLYNKALRLYPIEKEEHCNSPTCHRITFMYAPLYEHDQLNTATHNALHEMFGIANMDAFRHLAEMTRQGRIVTADGQNRYLGDQQLLSRLAIPITFIHGEENACFLPKSTAITHQLLAQANGRHLYQRHVIPRYGHIDCIYGKQAATDVYPLVLAHLEKTAHTTG
jgi:cholesterol oxidase